MFERKKSRPQKRIDCLIGAGTTVRGDVTFTGGVRIDGEVYGTVATVDNQPGTLVISEKARIDGEVRVSHVVINGAVNGPVTANDYLELQARRPGQRGCGVPDAGNARRRDRPGQAGARRA